MSLVAFNLVANAGRYAEFGDTGWNTMTNPRTWNFGAITEAQRRTREREQADAPPERREPRSEGPLFRWTTTEGEMGSGSTAPMDPNVFELILTRNPHLLPEGHVSHPEHEEAMKWLGDVYPKLQILRISGCHLQTFPMLPPTIMELHAAFHRFRHLPPLGHLPNLISMELSDGLLEDIRNSLPPKLANLSVQYNRVYTIEIRSWPTDLANIYALGNVERMHIDVTPPHYEQRIQRDRSVQTGNVEIITVEEAMGNRGRPLDMRPIQDIDFRGHNARVPVQVQRGRPQIVQKQQTVFQDTQNVHDHGVQTSVKKNLSYITEFTAPKRTKQELFASIREAYTTVQPPTPLKKKKWYHVFTKPAEKVAAVVNPTARADFLTMELETRLSQPYSMHGFTLMAVVERLWARILAFEGDTKATALQRFEEEVREGAPHCTNGFMVRMANVLIGLDENVVLKLDPQQILQVRVPRIMIEIRKKGADGTPYKEGEEPWQWARDCFIAVMKELTELEITVPSRREDWLLPFYEGFIEELMEGVTKSKVEATWLAQLPMERWAVDRAIQSAPMDKDLSIPNALGKPMDNDLSIPDFLSKEDA